MRAVSYDEVQAFLRDFLLQKLQAQGRDMPADFSDKCDLLLSGLIDSLGLLEIVTALSGYCGRELDFEEMDPDQITIVGPLCRFVADQTATN